MAPQEILKALKERPFMPIRIHLSDGSAFNVLDPSDATMDILTLYVGTDPDDESGLFRKMNRISPSHVMRIEPMPELRPRTAG